MLKRKIIGATLGAAILCASATDSYGNDEAINLILKSVGFTDWNKGEKGLSSNSNFQRYKFKNDAGHVVIIEGKTLYSPKDIDKIRINFKQDELATEALQALISDSFGPVETKRHKFNVWKIETGKDVSRDYRFKTKILSGWENGQYFLKLNRRGKIKGNNISNKSQTFPSSKTTQPTQAISQSPSPARSKASEKKDSLDNF